MNKLYDSVDYNNLKFGYVGPTKDVSLMNTWILELFNAIRDGEIGVSEVKNKQNHFLNKVTNIKNGKKTLEQEKIINNIERFYVSRQEVINCFRDYTEMLSDANYHLNKMRLKGQDLKY